MDKSRCETMNCASLGQKKHCTSILRSPLPQEIILLTYRFLFRYSQVCVQYEKGRGRRGGRVGGGEGERERQV